MSERKTRWLVVRTDDNGINHFVADVADQRDASALIDTFLKTNHKQNYWAFEYPAGQLENALTHNRIMR